MLERGVSCGQVYRYLLIGLSSSCLIYKSPSGSSVRVLVSSSKVLLEIAFVYARSEASAVRLSTSGYTVNTSLFYSSNNFVNISGLNGYGR